MSAKIDRAKEYLGTNWVGHPDYQRQPRHSNDPLIYGPARQPYLTKVIEAGAAARARNPFSVSTHL